MVCCERVQRSLLICLVTLSFMRLRESTELATLIPTVTVIRLRLAVSFCGVLEDTLCSPLVRWLETSETFTSS